MSEMGVGDLSAICENVRDASGGSNTLVLAPAFTEGEDDLCSCLLSGTPPASTNVLWVTFSDDAADRLAVWQQRHDSLPANLGIVEVGGATADEDLPLANRESVRTVTVSKPGDLTGTGVRLSEIVSDWKGDGNQLAVCLYGLTVLLQYADHSQLYRFLHIVARHMEEADAVAHYHLDPTVMDEKQLGTLLSLFDSVIDRENGQWRQRHK